MTIIRVICKVCQKEFDDLKKVRIWKGRPYCKKCYYEERKMKVYDYYCRKCDIVKENVIVNDMDEKIECKSCGNIMKRQFPNKANVNTDFPGSHKRDYNKYGRRIK